MEITRAGRAATDYYGIERFDLAYDRKSGMERFLRNHAPDIAAMDLFAVPTLGINLLCAFVIVCLDRKELVWIKVTTNPTAEWIARQLTEAFPWAETRST